MKIVIIEDERITADDLQQTLKQIDPSVEITFIIHSVKEGQAYSPWRWFKFWNS